MRWSEECWTFPDVLLVLALLPALCLGGSEYAPALSSGYHPYSSCHLDTGWTKGSGPMIKSFLRSIVPTVGRNRCPTNPDLFATFTANRRLANSIAVDYSLSTMGWKKFGSKEFDGWLFGRFDNIREMSGGDLVFVYDDFRHGLRGAWRKGVMLAAREVRIRGYRCKRGLMEIQTTRPGPADFTFFFERPRVGFVTSHPTVLNVFDRHAVYIANSSIEGVVGDGIFAKRDFAQGSLVAYYAGAPLYDYGTVMFPNMTKSEKEERHKNLLSYSDDYDLDCPQSDIVKYRAALGHKSNHAFDANVKFCFVKSPRFGETRCLEATRDIQRGEEVTVDYRYNLESSYVPRWYSKLYYETYPNERKVVSTAEDDPNKKSEQEEEEEEEEE